VVSWYFVLGLQVDDEARGFPWQAHDATSALSLECVIVEVSWNIRYDIKGITANKARQTTFMKGTEVSANKARRMELTEGTGNKKKK
jgi:hypothetical protein